MSFTLSVSNKNKPIEGSIALGGLANFSDTFYAPDSPTSPQGFILSDKGTCVGIIWQPDSDAELDLIKKKLVGRQELQEGAFNLQSVQMGGETLSIARLLLRGQDLNWVSDIFQNDSRFWLFEQTAWQPQYKDIHDAVPREVKTDERHFIYFPAGSVSAYFKESKSMNGDDQRGELFRINHKGVPEVELAGQLFLETFNQYGYPEGLRLLTDNNYQGMRHTSTIIYHDKTNANITVAHLKHEESKSDHSWVVDTEGNRLVVTGKNGPSRLTTEGIWPYPIKEAFQPIERVLSYSVENQIGGIEVK